MKTAVIGIQFGDEGKAKMISYFLTEGGYRVVARYQGGANAGHTQMGNGNEVITHVIPSGILYPDVYNVVLADVIVNPEECVEEITDLRKRGYDVSPNNLGISSRVHMTLGYHLDFEKESERRKGKRAVGSTMRGIMPTAVTKYGREGLRFAEFLNLSSFKQYLRDLSECGNANIIAKGVDVADYLERYAAAREFLAPFMIDDDKVLRDWRNHNWLYEGAQAVMLSILYGTYPDVTSSDPAGAPSDTDERRGVMKAYVTRVGGGNLPTRMPDSVEKRLRGELGVTPGAEFGATTRRPRRCGWFDGPAARYAADIGRIDRLGVTKLDRLTGLEKILVATGYKYKGTEIVSFPADRYVFQEVEPIYIELPGWEEDITNARELRDLPENTIEYLKRLEELVDRHIWWVSVGQAAEETVEL